MRASLPVIAPAPALAREWLLRNDRGDVACGTACGAPLRLRHVALATADVPGVLTPRLVRLDTRAGDGRAIHEFAPPDPRTPTAARAVLESFTREPWPTWQWRAGESRLEQQLLLLHDAAALACVWRHVDGPRLRIAVTPALPADDAQPADERVAVQAIPGRVRLGPPGAPRLTLWHDGAFLPARSSRATRDGDADPASRLAAIARAEVPGFIEAMPPEGGALHVVVAVDEALLRHLAEHGRLGTPAPRSLAGCIEALFAAERVRLETIANAAVTAADTTARAAWAARHRDDDGPSPGLDRGDPLVPRLARALDERTMRPSRLPHPLLESGAVDAVRAIRGLVTLGRLDAAREVLLVLGQLVRDGLVPSGFDAHGAPRYDSPDASLWLVIATELFARRTGEHEFIARALYAPVVQVIERFRSGTRLGLEVGDDGLLVAGGVARADLNALWYTAQAAMGQLARDVGHGQDGAFHLAWAREHQARFHERLWDEALDAPFLSIGPAGAVRGVEPSLLLAASLSPAVLGVDRARPTVARIERELLTPAGPREAPGSSRIAPEWMGHFLTALLRAHGRDAAVQSRARQLLARFIGECDACAAGHVPEAFELTADAALAAAPLQAAGDLVSLAGNADLLRFVVEELDPAAAAEREQVAEA